MAFLTTAFVFLLSFLPRKGIDVKEKKKKKKKDRRLGADNELRTYIDRRRHAVVTTVRVKGVKDDEVLSLPFAKRNLQYAMNEGLLLIDYLRTDLG